MSQSCEIFYNLSSIWSSKPLPKDILSCPILQQDASSLKPGVYLVPVQDSLHWSLLISQCGAENHRIMKVFFQQEGWKRPAKSSNLTFDWISPCPLNPIMNCHFQGWWLHHLPDQPVPMLNHSSSEEFFLNIQPEPPLAQLQAVSPCPITGCLEEEVNSHLITRTL